MKRQEELNEAWGNYMGKCSIEIMQALAFALRWADQHPHWISVFDETPKVDMLILVVHLGVVTTFRYQYERAEVLKNVFGITHWMPLPEAPKEGGEE